MKLKIILLALLIGASICCRAQILFTESFSVILDSAKTIKGNTSPYFRFQTLRDNFIEFENTADISFKVKKNAVTVANKIEYSKFGKQPILSGGYLFVEYRKLLEQKYVIEPFVNLQWADARGLEFKDAGGVNLRYRIISKNKMGLFVGIGPFYEYERWNYNGIQDSFKLAIKGTKETSLPKLGSYISYKWKVSPSFFIDLSVYHQSKFNSIFSTPRLASSSSVIYSISDNIGFILKYQNIYDFRPTVPIRNHFERILLSVNVSL